ncbi:MAG TPA: glycosyltransferase [Candidatus Saccharimonadales bacterium]|nr:glycosyltransferase [Candidatus Saccharimonadales bacterium]
MLDVRPLQEPDRAPLTAIYLACLLAAFADEPLAGESFTVLFQAGLPDPTESLVGLAVAGRRPLPPTRLLGSGALTLDPFLLRTAAVGAAWRAGRSGATGAVYHAASGAAPLLSGLPLVVTLLDLAPWEMPQAYQRSPAARFGQRLRGQILRDARAVVVPTEASARSARRLLHLRPERLHVVPLAPRPAFRPGGQAPTFVAARERLGLPERYFVYAGRYDARQDLATLLRALARVQAGHEARRTRDVTAPIQLPRVLLVGATPDDRAALARAAAREGVGELLAYAPRLDDRVLAALVVGARAVILPAVSESAGLAAIEAIACGTPVIASAVGGLPEIVGAAGILVEPRDPARLSAALEAAWADDAVHGRLADAAAQRARSDRRTWSDVARDTRRVYAEATMPSREGGWTTPPAEPQGTEPPPLG